MKSRDTLTPIGPYIVDRDDVADPHRLALSTYVNGELRQRGSTADMIFDIPFLIAYLSEFMTLQPGDMIATGTPKGLADVQPGDEVVVEIEGIGRLVNHIISEKITRRACDENHQPLDQRQERRQQRVLHHHQPGERRVAGGGGLRRPAGDRPCGGGGEEAFPKWANTPMKERARLMRRPGELIDQNVPQIAELETADTGLPIHQTKNVLIPRASHNFEFFAEVCQQMNGKTYPVDDKMLNYTLVQPVGVCALVSPWNVPFMTATENRALPGAGQHRSAEDVRTVAADRRSPGRAGAGGRHSGRGAERGAGLRRHRRRRAGAP